MAYDLIFGSTSRDWSCGGVMSFAEAKDPKKLQYDLFANQDASKLGSLVKKEIQENFNTAFRLENTKRLPLAERQAFCRFMTKWVDFNFQKDEKFSKEDFITLLNFREANKRFTERLAVFDQLAKTPLKTPVASTALAKGPAGSPPPAPPSRAWAWLLSLGLGLAGLSFIRKSKF
jgi:hypothetical protein